MSNRAEKLKRMSFDMLLPFYMTNIKRVEQCLEMYTLILVDKI